MTSIRQAAYAAALLLASLFAFAQVPLPAGVTKVTSVEGITEYNLPNGLRVLFAPDSSKPSTTVNTTYLVGSRHENYGETGMAHLLEHLLFKGTPAFRRRGSSSPSAGCAPTAARGPTAPTTSPAWRPTTRTSSGTSSGRPTP
jgi:zinc protease